MTNKLGSTIKTVSEAVISPLKDEVGKAIEEGVASITGTPTKQQNQLDPQKVQRQKQDDQKKIQNIQTFVRQIQHQEQQFKQQKMAETQQKEKETQEKKQLEVKDLQVKQIKDQNLVAKQRRVEMKKGVSG